MIWFFQKKSRIFVFSASLDVPDRPWLDILGAAHFAMEYDDRKLFVAKMPEDDPTTGLLAGPGEQPFLPVFMFFPRNLYFWGKQSSKVPIADFLAVSTDPLNLGCR